MDSAVTELAQRALAEVVAAGRIVTRVAVTVSTATFYTRTKIRKLDTPSTDADVITAPWVVVLSEAAVRKYFTNEDPIGKTIEMGWGRGAGTRRAGGEVVTLP